MKLRDGEQSVKSGSASYIKGKLNAAPGVLTLTDQRLVFSQRNAVFAAFGLIGALLGMLSKGKDVVDLPLGQIAGFSRGKYGINTNVVVIETRDGQTHRFGAKFDDWAAVLVPAGIAQSQPVAAQ